MTGRPADATVTGVAAGDDGPGLRHPERPAMKNRPTFTLPGGRVWRRPSWAHAALWPGLPAFLLPLAVYLLTLAPTVYNLDSAELTTAASTGGLVRATGYPLYLSIGYVWSKLPLGDVGYRMNLLSAVCGAGTIAVAERILRRWGVGTAAAFGALGLLATSPAFWGLSLVAEVYTLHTLIMAGLFLALLRWADAPEDRLRAGTVGLLLGLGMAHHAAIVLLLPAAALYVLLAAPRALLRPRTLVAGAVGLAIGLLPFLYLPLRHAAVPAFNYAGVYDGTGRFIAADLRSVAGIWWLVSGKAFAGQMLAYTPLELRAEWRRLALLLSQSFFAIGILPGLIGMVMLLWRRRPAGVLLLAAGAASAMFFVDYRAVDKETMFLPVYLVWALCLGVGYQWLLDWLGQTPSRGGQSRGAGRVMRALIVGLALAAVAWNWRLADLSQDRSARDMGEAVLAAAAPGALVLGWWDTVPVVEYLQLVEGRRPDVQAINRFLLPAPALAELIRQQIRRRPVYIDSIPPELQGELRGRPAGPLLRLSPRSAGRAEPTRP